MDFWAEVVVGIEISSGNFGSPIQVHVHGSIANEHSLEVKLATLDDSIRVLDEHFCQSRQVSSSIRLTTDPETILSKFWELLEPCLKGVIVVLSCSGVVVDLVGGVIVDAETNSGRTLDEK